MSWRFPFYYASEEEYKKHSIGTWIKSLFEPSLTTITTSATTLIITIGLTLLIALFLFKKLKVI